VVAGAVRIEAIVDDRPPEPHGPAVLTVVAPGGTAVALRDGLRIGRNSDNDIVVRDGRASRVHARIVADGAGFAIEDAGSTNGTFLDGERVSRAPLHAGASIVVGETVLDVRG
jgi:pSer/pThr/pTyr-binding forkhead associated (FHA) protein